MRFSCFFFLHLQAKRVSTRSTLVLARLVVDGLIQCPRPLACSVLLVPSAGRKRLSSDKRLGSVGRATAKTHEQSANQQEAANKPKPKKLPEIVRSTIMERTTNTT